MNKGTRHLRCIVDRHADIEVSYQVPPHPKLLGVAHELLGDHPRAHFNKPLDYVPFVGARKRACLILTDSGGVQDEAPALGKPVLAMCSEIERSEAVDEGVVHFVETDEANSVAGVSRLHDDTAAYRTMARGVSLYGNGKGAQRIAGVLREAFAATVK